MNLARPVRYRHDDALTRVSWTEFERLVADHYRLQGYVVETHGTDPHRRAPANGIDLKLRRGGDTILVTCRHWVVQQVPHEDVLKLMGMLHTNQATGAIVITSGEFTRTAIEAAARFRHVKLIDGMAIRAMLGHVVEPTSTWTPMTTGFNDIRAVPTPAPKPRATAAVMAAVGAVVVMSMLLVALYSFYIGEIHRAQMDALRKGAAIVDVVAEWHRSP